MRSPGAVLRLSFRAAQLLQVPSTEATAGAPGHGSRPLVPEARRRPGWQPLADRPQAQEAGRGRRRCVSPARLGTGACKNALVSSSPGFGWVTVSAPPLLGLLQQHRPGRRVISGAAPFYRRARSGPALASGLLQTSFFGAIRAPAWYWVDQRQPAMYKNTGC
ncbi:hypothetical protein NDU88_004943 [Pleurodeles waltl]|uniref:Uncharacterized protein n=1 Tax=Pleurodeles waltl TaxID=8319 RepID=A0AAV7WVS9_PLEWA|nr:hypothetical protein NDU88_004943 [Pleurodeles waltl]